MAAVMEAMQTMVPLATQQADELFVGPLVGEFGHEIMFAGYARAQAKGFKRVTVCTRPGREALHKDYATRVTTHEIKCQGMCMSGYRGREGNFVPTSELTAYLPMGMQPLAGREYMPTMPARFIRYGTAQAKYKGAVVLHARWRTGHHKERNWPQKNWNRLARWLLRKGLAADLICVGLKDRALGVEGALDLRGASLREQMDVLASARLMIGPSSGPIHLASHCGCPHVVWCGGGPGERRCTRRRYEGSWNPHKTPVRAYEYASWKPTFETVRDWTTAFLKELP